MYKGNATFTSALSLDGSGLWGAGEINFLTAHVEGDELVFLPDSIIGPLTAFGNQLSTDLDVPEATTSSGFIHFDPHIERLEVTTQRDAVGLYDGEGELSGTLADAVGLHGAGYLDMAKAGLEARGFSFKRTSHHAACRV